MENRSSPANVAPHDAVGNLEKTVPVAENRSSLANVALPLGNSALEQDWHTQQVTAGVWHHEIVRYTTDSPTPEWSWRSQPLRTGLALSESLTCADAAAMAVVRDPYPYPGNDEQTYDIVRVGAYQTRAAALDDPEAAFLRDCGYRLQRLNDTSTFDSGPWRINILEVDPAGFQGRMALGLAGGKIAGLEPVTKIAARENALAAVNASFFVLSEKDGILGDIAGLGVYNGQLVSEGVIGRNALILGSGPRNGARIRPYDPGINLIWPDGSITFADGINRRPDYTRNCDNADNASTSVSVHDATCTDEGEIIVFNGYSGFEPDAAGALTLSVSKGGRITTGESDAWSMGDGYLLVATGDRAVEVSGKLQDHDTVQIRTGSEGEEMPTYAVNGGPMLLSGGAKVNTADREGWLLGADMSSGQADAVHRWFNVRNPRTAAGITGDGRLLLVTVDGRQPSHSVGATIRELRSLMQSIGATDAINLDGGGSTTMVVGEAVVNRPSDPTGPRPVADALLVLPPTH